MKPSIPVIFSLTYSINDTQTQIDNCRIFDLYHSKYELLGQTFRGLVQNV